MPGDLNIPTTFTLAAMSLSKNFYFIVYFGEKNPTLKIFRLTNILPFH